MQSPATLTSTKCGQSVTPVACNRNNLKIPSRKLLQQGSATTERKGDNWSMHRGFDKDEKWDGIASPQFVDFANLSDIGDSFFERTPVFASTPQLKLEVPDDDTLISSLSDVSLCGLKYDAPDVTVKHAPNDKDKEQYVVHDASVKVDNKVKAQKWNKVKKPASTAVNPFTFDTREKYRQEKKQEKINKILEEEKKMRIFRANPVPKFLKTRTTAQNSSNDHNRNSNNNNDRIKNENTSDNANVKPERTNFSDRHVKKSTELWKKPPFIPCLSRPNTEKPKTPALHSALRALERKRFDEAVQEKERQKLELRRLEVAAKKKEEEEEIARLRKQTVHKAQPIPKYKLGLPQIKKRPLTDPLSPKTLKRRRRA